MSNIDKRALREAAEKASTDNHTQDEWFHYLRCSTPETVLALLDELEESERLRLKFQDANCELCQKLEAAEKRNAELERDETQLIEERDSAEKALADMYEAVMGDRPEWSNLFGYAAAIDDVAQRVSLLDIAAAGKGE